jgi:hypothetical protein
MGRRCRYVLGTAVVVVVLAAAGCGGGGGGEAASPPTSVEPSPSSEPTSPSTAPTEEAAVLAAYQGYWDTWLAANDPPNPDHPDLERYYIGRSLERARQEIFDRRAVGQAIRLPASAEYRHRADVTIDGVDAATVTDCSVDDSQVVDVASGRVLNDAVVSELITASLVRVNDEWRVQLTSRTAAWEGVAGCAA